MYILNIIFVLLIGHHIKAQVCPSGWTGSGGRCYTLTDIAAEDWGYAEDDCRMLRPESQLASFSNEVEAITVIESLCAGQGELTTQFWTGLNDLDNEAATNRSSYWSFTNGADPTYIRNEGQKWWLNNQPNNRFNSEDCVAVINGQLDDKACTLPLQACCAYVPSPSPSPSLTPSTSPSPSLTSSMTQTLSSSPSVSASESRTSTRTSTTSSSPSLSSSRSRSNTVTRTLSPSSSVTRTTSPSLSISSSKTSSGTPSGSYTMSISASPSPSSTQTVTSSISLSRTSSLTVTATSSPTSSSTITTSMRSISVTPSTTPTASFSSSLSRTPFYSVDTYICAVDSGTTIRNNRALIRTNTAGTNYVDYMSCFYTVIAPADLVISFTFSQFATESCCDFFEIYDGRTSTATRIFRGSGNTIPGRVLTTGPFAHVRWTTDYSIIAAGVTTQIEFMIPPSPTPTITPTTSSTPSLSPTMTRTMTLTATGSMTASVSMTASITPSTSITPSITPSSSRTPSGTPAPSPEFTLLASASRDFANRQGFNGWSYGYYLSSAAAYRILYKNTEFSVGSNIFLYAGSYCRLGATYLHPNAGYACSTTGYGYCMPSLQWTTTTGQQVQYSYYKIRYDISHSHGCGDGVKVQLLADGQILYQDIDSVGIISSSRTFTRPSSLSTIELRQDPNGGCDCDQVSYTLEIYGSLPSPSVTPSISGSPSITSSITPSTSSSPSYSPSETPDPSYEYEDPSYEPSYDPFDDTFFDPSISPSASSSVTGSSSITSTLSNSVSPSISPTMSTTVSQTVSSSITRSSSITSTLSNSVSASVTGSPTASTSVSPSITGSSSITSTASISVSPSVSMTVTGSPSISSSASNSASLSVTGSPSITSTASNSASLSVTGSPSISSSASNSASLSVTGSPSITSTPSNSASLSVTGSPSITSTASNSASPSVTGSPSITSTPSNSASPSVSMTVTGSSSISSSASNSVSPTITGSPSITSTASNSASPSVSMTVTGSSSITSTPSNSASLSVTGSPTTSTSVSPSLSISPTRSPSTTLSPVPLTEFISQINEIPLTNFTNNVITDILSVFAFPQQQETVNGSETGNNQERIQPPYELLAAGFFATNPDAEPITISTDTITLTIAKLNTSTTTVFGSEDSPIVIPPLPIPQDAIVYVSNTILSTTEMSVFNLTSNSTSIGVVSLTGKEYEVSNLQNPITVGFGSTAVNTTEQECSYWNTSIKSWSSDGCTLIVDSAGQAMCECTHLTEFALRFRAIAAINAGIINSLDKLLTLEGLKAAAPIIGLLGGIGFILLIIIGGTILIDRRASRRFAYLLDHTRSLEEVKERIRISINDSWDSLSTAKGPFRPYWHRKVGIPTIPKTICGVLGLWIRRIPYNHPWLALFFRFEPGLPRLFRAIFIVASFITTISVSILFYGYRHADTDAALELSETIVLSLMTTAVSMPLTKIMMKLMYAAGRYEFRGRYGYLATELIKRQNFLKILKKLEPEDLMTELETYEQQMNRQLEVLAGEWISGQGQGEEDDRIITAQAAQAAAAANSTMDESVEEMAGIALLFDLFSICCKRSRDKLKKIFRQRMNLFITNYSNRPLIVSRLSRIVLKKWPSFPLHTNPSAVAILIVSGWIAWCYTYILGFTALKSSETTFTIVQTVAMSLFTSHFITQPLLQLTLLLIEYFKNKRLLPQENNFYYLHELEHKVNVDFVAECSLVPWYPHDDIRRSALICPISTLMKKVVDIDETSVESQTVEDKIRYIYEMLG